METITPKELMLRGPHTSLFLHPWVKVLGCHKSLTRIFWICCHLQSLLKWPVFLVGVRKTALVGIFQDGVHMLNMVIWPPRWPIDAAFLGTTTVKCFTSIIGRAIPQKLWSVISPWLGGTILKTVIMQNAIILNAGGFQGVLDLAII